MFGMIGQDKILEWGMKMLHGAVEDLSVEVVDMTTKGRETKIVMMLSSKTSSAEELKKDLDSLMPKALSLIDDMMVNADVEVADSIYDYKVAIVVKITKR